MVICWMMNIQLYQMANKEKNNMWGCVFSVHPFPLYWFREHIYTLSYYHHQIGSMSYYPLFRIRSWNNSMHCMSFYILMECRAWERRLRLDAKYISVKRYSNFFFPIKFDRETKDMLCSMSLKNPLLKQKPIKYLSTTINSGRVMTW